MPAMAGVYSERLMKDDTVVHSIHLQNILLYFWGQYMLFKVVRVLAG